MSREFLKVEPQNLPTYVYHLEADIALVKDRLAYKIKAYSFSNIVIVSNQPLRPGDVVNNSCCYYGNENTEIIPHLQEKRVLGGAEKELKYFYGCKIDRLTLSYVDTKEDCYFASCGEGYCTVFIELSASALRDKFRELNNKDDNELSQAEIEFREKLRDEYYRRGEIDYWKERIIDWDKRLECIGEIPKNLIY